MSMELTMLVYAVFLLLLQLVLQAGSGILQSGLISAAGARDDEAPVTGFAGRFERAFYNMLETFPVFVALVLALEVTEGWTSNTALGAQAYFWARVLYVPAYVSGIPFVRTIIWAVSVIGMLMIAWPLLMQAT